MEQNQKQLKVRDSSIELLRIISMVLIVSCHFATHGNFSFDTGILSIPRLWWSFIKLGGDLGVDVFVLISGYFLVTSEGRLFNLKRVLKFWGQVAFYSIAIYLFVCVIGTREFELISCIKMFFPITFKFWWFASTYFVLYLIHPFINMLLQKLEKKTYQAMIVMQLVLWCIIPTLTAESYQSNSLVWFVTLYCIAGYIRLFGLNPRFSVKSYVSFFLLFSALRYLSCVAIMLIGTRFSVVAPYSTFFYDRQSVLTLLCAVSLFMIFEIIDIGYIKWINIVASATFGVYLIHDNSSLRHFIWQQVFKNAQYKDSPFLIPYSIIVIAVVYISCTLIELLRQQIIEKPFLVVVDRYSPRMTKPFEKLLGVVKSLVFGKNN